MNGPEAPIPTGWYCEKCNTEFLEADKADREMDELRAQFNDVQIRLQRVIHAIELRPESHG